MRINKEIRYFTIQTRYRKSRCMYVSRKKVPEIRISGIWLAEKGFYPKKKIKVTVRENFLGIELNPGNYENGTI